MNIIKDSLASLEFLESIKKESFTERVALFICGTLISALSFTIFYKPLNLVTGGTTGLSIIINELIGINNSLFVFGTSFLILMIGLFTLGLKNSLKTLLGVIMYPIFLEFTTIFTKYIDVNSISPLLISVMGGILSGFSSGIILKSGFSLGGFQTVYQIIYKYLRISIGKSSLFINGIIVFISGFFFGFDNVLYAIIALYVSTVVTDKVLLGTSECKTFHIITTKAKEVNEFITTNLGHSATVIDAKGGFTDYNKKIIMCVVPTRQYLVMKEVVKEIDKNAFFVATDTYEVRGGK